MNNEGLKDLIAQFGSRIFCINLNNNHKIFVNMAGDNEDPTRVTHVPLTSEFKYMKTKDGDDLFGVPHVKRSWGKNIAYTSWVRTALIEIVMVLDDPNETRIPDLNGIM